MSNFNNNETYKLLELSDHSESELELPELVSSPKKKKVRRKLRRTRTSTIQNVQPICMCNSKIFSFSIVGFLLTTWIIMLTWLAIVLHNEIQRLDSTVARVASSSQTVPVELQRLHTAFKSLQQNQTIISSRIDSLKMQLDNFTKDVSEVQASLNKIQEKLHSIPDHVNVPQQLQDVSASIANLGSQIKDITTTVAVLKSAKEELENNSNFLVKNVTSLRQSILNLQNTTQVPAIINTENNAEIKIIQKTIDGIKNNITTINSTLSNNIIWIREDMKKNNKNIESISNVGQNMSARVTTLEGICGKTSPDQVILSTNLKGLTDELQILSTNVQNHSIQISDLQGQIYQLTLNNTDINTALNTINHILDLKTFTQSQDAYHERETEQKTESPSSTVAQEPEVAAATEKSPTGKPAILTS